MQLFINRTKEVSRKFLPLLTGLCLGVLCLTASVACAGDGGGGRPAKVSDAASQLKLPSGFSAVTVVEAFDRSDQSQVLAACEIGIKIGLL